MANKTTKLHPIRRKFSRSALVYDRLTKLQEDTGRQLLDRVSKSRRYASMLDIGMGTGRLTQAVSRRFHRAKVAGIDLADGMVRRAHRRAFHFSIVQADAQALPFKPDSFDLIFSNATYQWVPDLPLAFQNAHESLRKGGDFIFSLFGRESLSELFESIAAASKGRLSHSRLPSKTAILAAMHSAGFEKASVHAEKKVVAFESMWALLVWLKNIGANALPRKDFVGRQMLASADEYYRKNFSLPENGIRATFEIIWVEARKI